MKRQTFKLVSAALLGVAVLASCQDYTPDEQAIVKKEDCRRLCKSFQRRISKHCITRGYRPRKLCNRF
jgi:hypothetical protein